MENEENAEVKEIGKTAWEREKKKNERSETNSSSFATIFNIISDRACIMSKAGKIRFTRSLACVCLLVCGNRCFFAGSDGNGGDGGRINIMQGVVAITVCQIELRLSHGGGDIRRSLYAATLMRRTSKNIKVLRTKSQGNPHTQP